MRVRFLQDFNTYCNYCDGVHKFSLGFEASTAAAELITFKTSIGRLNHQKITKKVLYMKSLKNVLILFLNLILIN